MCAHLFAPTSVSFFKTQGWNKGWAGEEACCVYWFLPRGDLLAKTKPGGYIQPLSDYDRRLKTLPDGSLTIMKLTIKDQGIYVANIHIYSGRSCLQIYNVNISGKSSDFHNPCAYKSEINFFFLFINLISPLLLDMTDRIHTLLASFIYLF